MLLADLPTGMNLLKFKRIPKTDKAFVVVTRNDESGEKEMLTTLVRVVGDDVQEIAKPIVLPCVYSKPGVETVDLEQDGVPEIVMIGDLGGAHGLKPIAVVRLTKSGLANVGPGFATYGWKVWSNPKTKAVELHATASTYITGEVKHPGDGKPLTIIYKWKSGKFVETKTVRR